MNHKVNKNQKIVFGIVSPIISKILEKYELKETDEEIFDKNIKGDFCYSTEIALLVYEVAVQKISPKNFPSEIQKRLNISLKKAKKIAEDLEKKVLISVKKLRVEKVSKKLPTSVKPSPTQFTEKLKRTKLSEIPETKKEKTRQRDIYRERIE